MRESLIIVVLFIVVCLNSFAQKKVIDKSASDTWEKLTDYNISDDGKYGWYGYEIGSSQPNTVLFSIDGKYKKAWPTYCKPMFTEDGNTVILTFNNDTVIIVDLISKKEKVLIGARSIKYFNHGGNQYLIYIKENRAILQNLLTSESKNLGEAYQFLLNPLATVVILQTQNSIKWIELSSGIGRDVCVGFSTNLCFNLRGNGLAFLTKKEGCFELQYYKEGMDASVPIVTERSEGIKRDFVLSEGSVAFTSNGENIFFRLKRQRGMVNKAQNAATEYPDIWHYKDQFLQSTQHQNLSETEDRSFLSVINVQSGRITQIEREGTKIEGATKDEYVLTSKICNELDAFWRKDQEPYYELINIESGSKIQFIPSSHSISAHNVVFSPERKFITWFDKVTRDCYSFQIAKGEVKNLSKNVHLPDDISSSHGDPRRRISTNVIAWLGEDKACFIKDKYDIWQIDPTGNVPPLNLTGGYGRKNNIRFDFLNITSARTIQVSKERTALLRLLDNVTMDNGFAVARIGSSSGLSIIKKDACLYTWRLEYEPRNVTKARNANVYLVTKQTASEAPNLFVSKDLKSFTQLSDIHPQKKYNWMTSQSISWRLYNDELAKGILYKPENFDSSKKYPIIFHYYQKRSDGLHRFINPGHSGMEIEIPEYVSSGYIVFVPDISNDSAGQIASITVNTVESAAKYLLYNFQWIDERKMGLQGHSHGGYETNIIVANSRMFAAASSSAGFSNLVSKFGGLGFGQESLQNITEIGQTNLGTTPWSNPEVYIKNSPIFYADKVVTPLLIKHGQMDGAVPFAQAVEWFTALRRLQKPVWLLAYMSDHVMRDDNNSYDFARRQRQFFDHYLKGAPAPLWMVEGVAAKDKGIITGFQLDSLNRVP